MFRFSFFVFVSFVLVAVVLSFSLSVRCNRLSENLRLGNDLPACVRPVSSATLNSTQSINNLITLILTFVHHEGRQAM